MENTIALAFFMIAIFFMLGSDIRTIFFAEHGRADANSISLLLKALIFAVLAIAVKLHVMILPP